MLSNEIYPDQDMADVLTEIERLGLTKHVSELDAVGLTVVEPYEHLDAAFVERLKDVVLDLAKDRLKLADVAEDLGPNVNFQHNQHYLYYLLFEHEVFQHAVCHPVVTALTTYLLGKSCLLYDCVAQVKGRGDTPFQLHCDNFMQPPPFPPYAQHANATWALTDYTRADGGLGFVPGSHKYCRQPKPGDGMDDVVAVNAPAGSLVLWHGHTWHTGLSRETPGYRANVVNTFCRKYIRPQEDYGAKVTDETLANNPPMFTKLMGREFPFGWQSHEEASTMLEEKWMHIWGPSYSQYT